MNFWRQQESALSRMRVAELEAQLAETRAHLAQIRAEAGEARATLERVVDNALFAVGARPVFHPEDERFQPRSREEQIADANVRPPLTPSQLSQKLELDARRQYERDRKAELTRGLQQLARERQTRQPQ